MNGWVDGWMGEWMNEWMNEWMHEWMNKWMNGWMNELLMDDMPFRKWVSHCACLRRPCSPLHPTVPPTTAPPSRAVFSPSLIHAKHTARHLHRLTLIDPLAPSWRVERGPHGVCVLYTHTHRSLHASAFDKRTYTHARIYAVRLHA